MVYGNNHHSLISKIGFRVIYLFIIDLPASKILIWFYKAIFFSFIAWHCGFSKSFKILKFGLSLSPLVIKTAQQILEL